MNKISFAVFLFAVFTISVALDCTNILVKEQEGVLSYLGNITFDVPISTSPETGWRISLLFDQIFTGVGVWNAFVSYNGTEKWAIIVNNATNGELDAGEEKSQRFRVNYGREIPQPPSVVSIRFQDIELCL